MNGRSSTIGNRLAVGPPKPSLSRSGGSARFAPKGPPCFVLQRRGGLSVSTSSRGPYEIAIFWGPGAAGADLNRIRNTRRFDKLSFVSGFQSGDSAKRGQRPPKFARVAFSSSRHNGAHESCGGSGTARACSVSCYPAVRAARLDQLSGLHPDPANSSGRQLSDHRGASVRAILDRTQSFAQDPCRGISIYNADDHCSRAELSGCFLANRIANRRTTKHVLALCGMARHPSPDDYCLCVVSA